MANLTTSSAIVTYTDGSTSTLSFSWTVDSVKVKNEGTFTNAIIQTYWSVSGTDGHNNTGTFKGATPFTTKGMTTPFVQFSDLQELDVLGWIQAQVVGQYADHVYEKIVDQLDAKVIVVSEPNLPWAPPSTSTFVSPPIDGGVGPQ
jgi:hypothetical protein